MSLFFTSAWCKDMTKEEREKIMEANGHVYHHGEEELYGIRDDVSSMSGSVRSETFLGKKHMFENFSFGFKKQSNDTSPGDNPSNYLVDQTLHSRHLAVGK